jgi:hypothetical protein
MKLTLDFLKQLGFHFSEIDLEEVSTQKLRIMMEKKMNRDLKVVSWIRWMLSRA